MTKTRPIDSTAFGGFISGLPLAIISGSRLEWAWTITCVIILIEGFVRFRHLNHENKD